ncbi:MAG: mechanosensitive ion channel [Bacteroidales bacterium]|nr:mechanosensitive ion channel [Bacteroidales bacterium]
MHLRDILSYNIVSTKTFSLSVYHLVIVLLVILATNLIIWVIKRIFKRQQKKETVDIGKSQAIFQIVKYAIWVIAISLTLDTIGIKITILLAGSAALLVGLGLGLQQIFQDIVSGVVILFERVIKVGDVVELPESLIGRVREIGLRTSKIETRDNIITIVPNSKFITDEVINWSHMSEQTRFSVAVGVAYGSNVDLVTELLLKSVKTHKDVSRSPQPFVRFKDFGESSLDFEVFFWTTNSFLAENIKSDMRYIIDRLFRESNVQIPFPQRDVHIIKGHL